MSQSPESLATSLANETQAERYRLGWKALSELIGQGLSFSGHEKNTCFLNTRDGRFADVSSATGLDFDDDGRAVAVCDWDFDGRQDLWVTNRTAPRVRLLRNAGKGGDWIALRLQGTSCNRDAIGARVLLDLGKNELAVKGVRAGDGFLAQSSKWLHFGVRAPIEKVTVYWPGGEAETIEGVTLNSYQTIVQGSGVAISWEPPTAAKIALQESPLPQPPAEDSMRTWLIGRLPLPLVRDLPGATGKPFLLNLWSHTCELCQAELADWTNHAAQIRSAGLEGLVLSVDALLGEETAEPPRGLPFASSEATREIAEALEVFHRTFVELQKPLPVPTSFLLDKEGRVAALYKGPVALETLLADVGRLERSEREARDAAVPFPGRWASNLFPPQPERLAEAYAAAGRPDWRDKYLSEYAARFPTIDARTQQAAALLKEGKSKEAVAVLAILLESSETTPVAHRQAGTLLLQHNLTGPARDHLRAALPAFENNSNFRFNLGLAEAANRNARGALENFRATAALDPNDAAAQFQIANVLHATRQSREAIPHYREALRLRAGWALPANNLAWLLATHPEDALRDGAAAVELIEPIVTAEGESNVTTLSTLAAAQAEAGDFAGALKTAKKALDLAGKAGAQPEIQSLRAALENYRAGRPLRSR